LNDDDDDFILKYHYRLSELVDSTSTLYSKGPGFDSRPAAQPSLQKRLIVR